MPIIQRLGMNHQRIAPAPRFSAENVEPFKGLIRVSSLADFRESGVLTSKDIGRDMGLMWQIAEVMSQAYTPLKHAMNWVLTLTELVGNRGGQCIFVKQANQVVSTAILTPSKEAGGTAEVSNVATLPACQGQGLGKIVMKDVIQAARKSNFKTLLLDVAENNIPATRLYRGLGFMTSGASEQAGHLRMTLDLTRLDVKA
jgi:GNAT superfamily N-acetyltransferase